MSFPFQLYEYEELGSTNDELRRLAQLGVPEGSAVLAERQNAGRGRRGRIWVSEPGNLYFSLLLHPRCSVKEAASLGFVAQLAVSEWLAKLLPASTKIQHKWPNDVLVNGKKISGLLLESSANAEGLVDWLILGLGINLCHHPEDALFPATNLFEEGGLRMMAEEAAQDFVRLFQPLYAVWKERGFAPLRSSWLSRAAFLGEMIKADRGEKKIEGIFKDIDAEGFLLLESHEGIQRIGAADIFPAIYHSSKEGSHAASH